MSRRRTRKEKTLWTEYPNYTPINNLEEKPLFDETRVNEEHQVLGQIVRDNWDLIHPLASDYMLSAATEWRAILTELHTLQSNLELTQRNLDNYEEDFQTRTQRLLLEKEAEFERAKEEIIESFKSTLVQKDEELSRHKMLAESVSAGMTDTAAVPTNQRIEEMERLVQELRDKAKAQEIEAMNIQTGISKNFQQQISDITSDLYEKQEQVDKLRGILTKAKEQLIALKEQNDALKSNYSQLSVDNKHLERMIEERDEKLRRVVKTIESLD